MSFGVDDASSSSSSSSPPRHASSSGSCTDDRLFSSLAVFERIVSAAEKTPPGFSFKALDEPLPEPSYPAYWHLEKTFDVDIDDCGVCHAAENMAETVRFYLSHLKMDTTREVLVHCFIVQKLYIKQNPFWGPVTGDRMHIAVWFPNAEWTQQQQQ